MHMAWKALKGHLSLYSDKVPISVVCKPSFLRRKWLRALSFFKPSCEGDRCLTARLSGLARAKLVPFPRAESSHPRPKSKHCEVEGMDSIE